MLSLYKYFILLPRHYCYYMAEARITITTPTISRLHITCTTYRDKRALSGTGTSCHGYAGHKANENVLVVKSQVCCNSSSDCQHSRSMFHVFT